MFSGQAPFLGVDCPKMDDYFLELSVYYTALAHIAQKLGYPDTIINHLCFQADTFRAIAIKPFGGQTL